MGIETIKNHELFTSQISSMPIFQELHNQYETIRPFTGVKVAIAHVLVPNTVPLILSCAIGGAELLVTSYEGLSPNPRVVSLLQENGITVQLDKTDVSEYDVAIDCGGFFAGNPPKYGVVEVTRSGILEYEKMLNRVIINVDSGKSKMLETFFGNPISVLNTLEHFFGDKETYLKNKIVGIFGFGKIGKGNARLFKQYCSVKVFDIDPKAIELAKHLGYDTCLVEKDTKVPKEEITIDILISATGFHGVISQYFTKQDLDGVLLLNLGAVDEFGDDYNEDEVFKSKHYPFNFNSDPPTPNMFIDAILAAQVEGLRYLVTSKLKPGLYPIPKDIDDWAVESFSSLYDFDLIDLKMYFPELN